MTPDGSVSNGSGSDGTGDSDVSGVVKLKAQCATGYRGVACSVWCVGTGVDAETSLAIIASWHCIPKRTPTRRV